MEGEESEGSQSEGKIKKKEVNAWIIGKKVGLHVTNNGDVVEALMEDWMEGKKS